MRSKSLLVIEIDDCSKVASPLVRFASQIEPDWFLEFFPERIEPREEFIWDRLAERVEQVNSPIYGQLTLDESSSLRPICPRLLAAKAVEAGVERIVDGEDLAPFLRRV